MVRRAAKLPRVRKATKPRKRANRRIVGANDAAVITQRVERTVKIDPRRSEIEPFREFQIPRGARIFEHEYSRKTDFAGLIFMCNTSTKQDCFRHRVFGLPEAKKHLVEQIRQGMTLFLFDVDLNTLHGIYKASSPGGFNLQADAFRGSRQTFPWQVRFTISKDCAPLTENVFKTAMKDNYDGNKKFRIELTGEQVQKLVKLFRSPQRDAAAGAPPRMAPLASITGPLIQSDAPPRIIYEPNFSVHDRHPQEPMEKKILSDPRARSIYEPFLAAEYFQSACEVRLPQEIPHHNLLSARLSIPEYIPVRASFPTHAADPIFGEVELRKSDPYPKGPMEIELLSAHSHGRSLGYRAVEVGDLYMQRLQPVSDVRERVLDKQAYRLDPLVAGSPVYTGMSNEALPKKAFEETYLIDRALMLLSKRRHVKELLPGGFAYQSGLPY